MTAIDITCRSLINTIRRQLPADQDLDLAMDGYNLRVSSNDPAIIRDLADYFAPFLTPGDRSPDATITVHEGDPPLTHAPFIIKRPDPGKVKVKEEFLEFVDGRSVRKRLTGMMFLFTHDHHLAVGPCRANLNQIVNFVNNRFIQWKLCSGSLLGHAAGVAIGGRGLAVAGFSGAGKSTLALELMRQPDCVFISNDRLMIAPRGNGLQMTGVAKLPRINPGTALNNPSLSAVLSPEEKKRFSTLPQAALWDLEHKYDVPLDRCFGPGRFELSAPMQGLVLLNWQRNREPLEVRQVDLSERRDLLPAFMKSTGLFFLEGDGCAMPEPTEDAYIAMLNHCSVWEFSGGTDFEAAGRQCRDLLASLNDG